MGHSHSAQSTHDHQDGHQHHDHSHHGHAPSTFNKAFAIAIFLNLSFTLIEAFYAIMAHSMSLLADAGHNLGDVLGLALAWGANLLLARGSSERYSYGFKKTTILAALINALILVAATAIIAYESIWKIFHPVMVSEKIVIVVALIGIFINSGTALLFIRGQGEDLNIKGAFLHLAYDALISLGVVIAGIIILMTHAMWIDPIVGLLIVVTILGGTWSLLKDSVNLILDAVPRQVEQSKVKAYLEKIPGVTAVHDLHIWSLSTNEIALTAHLIMPERNLTDADYVEINHELEHHYKIKHVTIQVEKGTGVDPCALTQKC